MSPNPTPPPPGRLRRALGRRLFSRVYTDPAWTDVVRAAQRRGTVVYVTRAVSFLDYFALDPMLEQHDLPPIRFVPELGLGPFDPMRRGIYRLLGRAQSDHSGLADTVARGHSALVFVSRSDTSSLRGRQLELDAMRTLLEQQARQRTPIVLVPLVFVWGRQPDPAAPGPLDGFFGTREFPGRLRTLAQMLRHAGNATLRACEPIDLRAHITESSSTTVDDAHVQRVHFALFRRLERERRVVLGPMARAPELIREEVLFQPSVRAEIAAHAEAQGTTQSHARAQAVRMLDRMMARPHPLAFTLSDRALAYVFSRMFRRLEVDTAGLARIRAAALRGPVVLLPTHRSHLDYLLISYVFYNAGMHCPLIASGENLSFFPAGPILRRAGAFFIKRSFKGQKLYAALVHGYLRKALALGHTVEFFLEGGRSRSGKLLRPKLGLLSMVVEAAASLGAEVSLVPLAIAYERVAEQSSYEQELSGGEKRTEDARALLDAPKVIAEPHGVVSLQVGEIVRLRAGEHDDANALREQVASLASRVTTEIHRVTPVTATALISVALLLEHPLGRGRSMAQGSLFTRIDRLAALLRARGARFVSGLLAEPGALAVCDKRALDESLAMLVSRKLVDAQSGGGTTWYAVADERRLALDFSKNSVIHFLVLEALLATVLRAQQRGTVEPTDAALTSRFEHLTRLMRHEFLLDARDALDDGWIARTRAWLLAKDDDDAADGARVLWFAALVRNSIESYRIATRTLAALSSASAQPLTTRDLVKRALERGRAMFDAGEVRLRESLCKASYELAFTAFADMGWIEPAPADTPAKPGAKSEPAVKWRLAPEHSSPEGVRALERHWVELM